MSKVFFTSSGSEANDSAVKLVWYYQNARGRPHKKKIISRQRAYHGVTVAAASLTGLPHVHRDFDLPLPGFLHADCPHHYRYAQPGESERDFAQRCVRSLEALILAEGPETIAAFIAEPVMGAGGVIAPPPGYFAGVQELLREYEILFIADEVICGFGRTGDWFGSQSFELQPDLVTVAKQLSSGYQPIGALLISEPIYRALVAQSEKLGVFGHGYTYGGHPVAAAVALETLRIYEERDVVGLARRAGAQLREGLQRLAQQQPLIGEVRGIGMLWGVELVEDRASKRAFDPARRVGPHAVKCAERAGLITRAVGDTLCLAPPLVISDRELDELLARFAAALAQTAAWLGA
jgi:4-aminobutyrate---pyruvate transaminase